MKWRSTTLRGEWHPDNTTWAMLLTPVKQSAWQRLCHITSKNNKIYIKRSFKIFHIVLVVENELLWESDGTLVSWRRPCWGPGYFRMCLCLTPKQRLELLTGICSRKNVFCRHFLHCKLYRMDCVVRCDFCKFSQSTYEAAAQLWCAPLAMSSRYARDGGGEKENGRVAEKVVRKGMLQGLGRGC